MNDPACDYALRVSICWNCALPLTGQDGDQTACTRCAQPVPFRPRASFLPVPASRRPGPQDPRLRAQDGKPLLPPANLAFLWENGQIPPHRLGEALVAWQGARRRSPNDLGAGEELVMLTRELAAAAGREQDHFRARALLESALEVAPVPRHRAALLGMLVRMAVRTGQLDDAGRWLAHFEPAAELDLDSEWRVSTAVLATAYRRYSDVLDALGPTFDAVAIQDALDPQAAVFRVHALACLGAGEKAKMELDRFFAAGPAMRNVLESIRAQYAALALCEGVFGEVRQARETQARAAAGVGKIAMGCVLLVAAVLPLCIAVGVAAYEYFTEGEAAAAIAIPFMLIFVLAFGLWGVKTLRAGWRERQVFAKGVRATARVLGARPSGVSVNDVPEMIIELEVGLNPPVRSAIKKLVHAGALHAYVPGALVHVRIDPQRPDCAVLEE